MDGESQREEYLQRILDAVPLPLLVVDGDLRVREANPVARFLFHPDSPTTLRKLCGEVLHCVHERESLEECGKTPACPDCVLRGSVVEAIAAGRVIRSRTEMILERGRQRRKFHFSVAASPFRFQGETLSLLVLADLTELLDLRQLVPICAGCRKVRKDDGYWEQVEAYVSSYTNLDFTHGLCPDCARRFLEEHEKVKGAP